MHYNEALADKQGLSEQDRIDLDEQYEKLLCVTEGPWNYDDPAKIVTEIEFELQRLWKFPQDAKFHRYQQHIDGCTCPVMDNFELVGVEVGRYRVSDCPWHWTQADKTNKQKEEV